MPATPSAAPGTSSAASSRPGSTGPGIVTCPFESGLKPDDKVVIAGLLRAIPGQKVDPKLQKIEQSPPSAAK